MGIFQIHRLLSRSQLSGNSQDIVIVEALDWVNVIPLTSDDEVVLVRQYRHGTTEFTLEIPGGQVDDGESPAEAGERELLEETGFGGGEPILLGRVTPNPAFLNNHCYTYLIEGCEYVEEPDPEGGEEIEVILRPLKEIPQIISECGIDHALVVAAFWWLAQARPEQFTP